MRFQKLVAAAALALACAAPVQADSSHWVGFHGSGASPLGDLKETTITSYGGGASYLYLWNDVIGLGADVDWYRWRTTSAYDAYIETLFGVGSRAKFNDFHYTLRAVLMAPLPGPIKPYAFAGTGAFNEKNRVESVVYRSALEGADNHHGWLAGGGVRVDLTRTLALTAQGATTEYSSSHFTSKFVTAQAGLAWRMPWGRQD